MRSRLFTGTLFQFFQTLLMAFAILIPAMYFSSLSISIVVYAFLLSIGDVFSFVMKPVVGYLTDKHGERKYLLVGGIIFFFSLFLIGQTTSILEITVLKIISGVASALVFVIIIIYSLRMVKERPDSKVGLFGGLSNLGWIFGLLIPGIFIDFFGIQPAFYLILIVGIIWTLLIFRFAKKYETGRISIRPSFSFMKRIPTFIIFKTMDLGMFSAFLFFFTRYALQTLGLSRSAVSFIVVVEVLLFAISNLIIGRISNRYLRRYWVPFCIFFHLLGATVMVFANSILHYYLVSVFIGIAGGFIDIWIYSKISETFEHYDKGKVIGTLGWSYDLATITGAQIPILFVAFNLGTFTALYTFPMIMAITYLLGRKYQK
jgi:MFS family permease